MCKPILKWVGGKRQLLQELKFLSPKEYNRYFEPFIGGGALFFDMEPREAFINDYNKELINLYSVVRDNPIELVERLKTHQNNLEYYYNIRNLDKDIELYSNLTNLDKASRFLYLNKTCFNGLYRVNSKGQFNVPFGKYKSINYDLKNIESCSKLLQSTELSVGDFDVIRSKLQPRDFVYLDPPYIPLNKSSSFTGYTTKGFDMDMQFRVIELCRYIDSVGAFFMASNSFTESSLDLYNIKGFNIHSVTANRMINSNVNGRGKIKEIVVTNY